MPDPEKTDKTPAEIPASGDPVFDFAMRALEVAAVIANIARRDPLTGLLNREAWKYNIEEKMEGNETFAVAFMDMDAFKVVNDTIGHHKGDELLVDFSDFLKKSFRRQGEAIKHERQVGNSNHASDNDEAMGRYGGDEFGFIINLSNGGRRDGLTIAQRMEKADTHLRDLFTEFVEGQPEEVQALGYNISVGYGIYEPSSHKTVEDLLKEADKNMYADKKAHDAPDR